MPRSQHNAAAETLEASADETMTDRAYKLIEELIVTLQLPPGTVLSEQMLSQRLAVARQMRFQRHLQFLLLQVQTPVLSILSAGLVLLIRKSIQL